MPARSRSSGRNGSSTPNEAAQRSSPALTRCRGRGGGPTKCRAPHPRQRPYLPGAADGKARFQELAGERARGRDLNDWFLAFSRRADPRTDPGYILGPAPSAFPGQKTIIDQGLNREPRSYSVANTKTQASVVPLELSRGPAGGERRLQKVRLLRFEIIAIIIRT